MRKFDGDDATRSEQNLQSTNKVVEVGYLGEYVVSEHQIAALALGDELAGSPGPKELNQSRDALLDRHGGNICSRLDPEHGDLFGHEVLEEVAIVAGDLRNQAVGV